jgi:signal peptidase I
MQVTVYDDRYRAASLQGDPRWQRWVPTHEGWTEPSLGSFHCSGQTRDWIELRYRHVVPDPDQWTAIREGKPTGVPPRPTLVTDFSSYNTDLSPQSGRHPRLAAKSWFQPHWVGDLTLSCRLVVRKATGRFRVDLIKGGHTNRCEIDLATGATTLAHDLETLGQPQATKLSKPGTYNLVLSNVDDRLTLLVDGAQPFGDGLCYETAGSETPPTPTSDDLEPARMSSRGAEVEVSDLVLKRDVYYTQRPSYPDFDDLEDVARSGPRALFDVLADPRRYAELGSSRAAEYELGPGRYLMLGDNSPWSRDGRAWGRIDQTLPGIPDSGWDSSGRESWEVPEELIIGKAFCVHWPHFKPVWPMIRLGADVRVPARPYIERMRWIR